MLFRLLLHSGGSAARYDYNFNSWVCVARNQTELIEAGGAKHQILVELVRGRVVGKHTQLFKVLNLMVEKLKHIKRHPL